MSFDDFDPETDSIEVIDVTSLTEEQWSEIRGLALQIYKSKQYGTDQLRCGVFAFMMWLEKQDAALGMVETDNKGPSNIH